MSADVADITRQAAEFVVETRPGDIPGSVKAIARRQILDGIGLAVAGSASDVHQIVRGSLDGMVGDGPATVFGCPGGAPPRLAALLNGISIHADDYDDTQLAVARDRVYGLLTHPTAPVLPAALAAAQSVGSSGEEFFAAYCVGVEVECKIAEAIDPRHYQHGFHTTATVGTFGAAAATARLMGLDVEATQRAFAVAGSQAAGLRENFGTMLKPYHAGRAAESGFVAADLARRGITGTSRILEAPRGFFRAAGGGFDAEFLDGAWGAPWSFVDPGVSIKPHPSGSLTHPGMWAMMQILGEAAPEPQDVESVVVRTNSSMPNALIHHRPTDDLQAKFSMEFCMAILLVDGRAGLPEYTSETVNREDVQAMIRRVDFSADREFDELGPREMTTRVEVTARSGETWTRTESYGKGHPRNPMSDDELLVKVRECLDWGGIGADQANDVRDAVATVEEVSSIRDWRPCTLVPV